MMYCPNCGVQVGESAFCTNCGSSLRQNSNGLQREQMPQPASIHIPQQLDKKPAIALWLSILMSPVLLIIRLLSVDGVALSRRGDYVKEIFGVPPAIIVIGFIILFIGVTTSLVLNNQKTRPSGGKKIWTNVLCILDIVLGFVILLVRTS